MKFQSGVTTKITIALIVLFALFSVFSISSVFADVVPDGMTNLPSTGASTTDVTKIVDSWVTNLRYIGIGLILIPIAVSAIMLGFSMGNSQRRGVAVGALLMAAIGIIILAKMHSLASWIAHQS